MNNRETQNGSKLSQSVMLGIPVYADICTQFVTCLMPTIVEHQRRKYAGTAKFDMAPCINAGDSAVGRSRNSITAKFLESDCTDLLFLDSDLVFSYDHILAVMEHDADVVGGVYFKKTPDRAEPVLNTKDGALLDQSKDLQEVNYTGTGFMRIRRRVFEKMIDAFGDRIRYQKDPEHTKTEYDFWHMGVYEYKNKVDWQGKPLRRYLSEDWWFCQMCEDLGIPRFVDCRITLGHIGPIMYPLAQFNELIFGAQPIPVTDSAVATDASVSLAHATA